MLSKGSQMKSSIFVDNRVEDKLKILEKEVPRPKKI
jgi:hypothetical protein